MQPDGLFQKQHYGIAIYDHETVLTDYTGDTVQRYLVDPARLITILNLPEPSVVIPMEPGMLVYSADRDHEEYLFSIPKKREGWTLFLRADKGQPAEEVKVHLPAFVLGVTVRRSDRRVVDIHAWCHSDRNTPSRDTRYYEMPLPNFTGSSHCLGANVVVTASPGRVREAGLEAVFDAYFNRHADLIGTRGIPFAQYLAKHQGRFPLRTLKKTMPPNNIPNKIDKKDKII